MRHKDSTCLFSFAVCLLFSAIICMFYVTLIIPQHLVMFQEKQACVSSERKYVLDLPAWNTRPGSCCAAGSFCISSINLHPLLSSSTLQPFPADSGFSPPLCHFVNSFHLFGSMTSWCCTMRQIRVLMETAERPLQNKGDFNASS